MILRRQFCLATSSLAALAFTHNTGAQTDSKIILGQSAPFTGPAAQLGIQFYEGAKLYFDSVNSKGGVNGKTIELRKLDDGYEPERSAANTKQFIADGVFALFGYIGTPTSVVALPLATEAKVPFSRRSQARRPCANRLTVTQCMCAHRTLMKLQPS